MRRLLLAVGVALVATFELATAGIAQSPSSGAQFLASNPGNGWEYGLVNGSGEFTLYNSTFDDRRGIAGWCQGKTPGPRGAVLANCTDSVIDRYGVTWRPGQICMRPPMGGGGVSIRWRSTFSGPANLGFSLTADAQNIDVYATITVNGQSIHEHELCNIVDSPYICSEFSHSSIIDVLEGDHIAITVSCVGGQPAAHVGAYLSVSPVSGGSGSVLGVKPPAKQAFGLPGWEAPSFESAISGGRS